MTSQNGATASDVINEEMDLIESAITAANRTLTPELWRAARTKPVAARTVAESIKALVDLHLVRDALKDRAELARNE